MRKLASVSTVTAGSTTLGVAAGPRQFIADQLLAKADVIRAMHERVQLCRDPQTEFALLRESLGVSRINHILRVRGHAILQEQSKSRSAQASLESGTRGRETLRLQHTLEHSKQPNRASRRWYKMQLWLALCRSTNSFCS